MTSNRFAFSVFLIAAVLLLCIPQAKADITYDLCTGVVTKSGACFAGNLFQFTVPTSPVLSEATAPAGVDLGFGFTILPTNLTENGHALASTDFLAFYSGSWSPFSPNTCFNNETCGGGGVALFNTTTDDIFDYLGPQLYSGPENHPTFLTLNSLVSLYDYDTFADPYIYQVSNPTSTPEPSTLPLLSLGLAAASLGVLFKR